MLRKKLKNIGNVLDDLNLVTFGKATRIVKNQYYS